MSQKNTCLVTVSELAEYVLGANVVSRVVIADCRFSLADIAMGDQQYLQGHIPSAHYFHLDRDMSAEKSRHGGRHPLPDPEKIAARLREVGVSHDSLVVCYDDQRFAFASRLWWLLRWMGHDNVVVLDGGYKAWQAGGLPVETGAACTVNGGDFKPRVDSASIVVRHSILQSNNILVDSREAPRYRGELEPIDPLAGHIPGAINKPWADVTNADGFALDISAQKNRWIDVADTKQVVVYCGSGVTACVNMLSLAMIGRDDAKLYAGSWSDWCSYVV